MKILYISILALLIVGCSKRATKPPSIAQIKADSVHVILCDVVRSKSGDDYNFIETLFTDGSTAVPYKTGDHVLWVGTYHDEDGVETYHNKEYDKVIIAYHKDTSEINLFVKNDIVLSYKRPLEDVIKEFKK